MAIPFILKKIHSWPFFPKALAFFEILNYSVTMTVFTVVSRIQAYNSVTPNLTLHYFKDVKRQTMY